MKNKRQAIILFLILVFGAFTVNAAWDGGPWNAISSFLSTAHTWTGKQTFSGGILDSTLTASKPVFTDASKNLVSTGTLAVDQGGTGAATLTDHGILLGSGTGAVTPMAAMSTGEIVYGVTGADPTILAAQTVASRKFLQQTGTGAVGQAPTWEAIISGDLTTALTTPPAIGATAPNDITATDLMFTAATELTIATGAITVTKTVHKIDTESNAASDDLDTISGGQNEQVILLRAEHADRTVVVKHNTGNILLAGDDVELDDTNKYLILIYDSGLSKWLVAGGSGSGALKTKDVTTPAYKLTIASNSDGTALTADRTLTFDTVNGARDLNIPADQQFPAVAGTVEASHLISADASGNVAGIGGTLSGFDVETEEVNVSGEYIQTTTLNAASGNEVAMQLNYTVNKAAGNDTGLEINMTDTLSPGTSLLIDAKVAGVSKAAITNAGQVRGISFNVNDGNLYLEMNAGSYPAIRSTSATGLRLLLGSASIGGNAFQFLKNSTSKLSGSNLEQSWLYANPEINQSGTAAYNGIKIDVTETTLGDGTTGDGNNLIRAAVGGVTKYKVSNAGVVTSGGAVINGKQAIKRTDAGAADYNPSALTDDYLITANNSAAARAITLSTEDVASGTTALPRCFLVKDEYGSAGAFSLTVSLEGGGTIDGAASAVITGNYDALMLYCTGTNCFIY